MYKTLGLTFNMFDRQKNKQALKLLKNYYSGNFTKLDETNKDEDSDNDNIIDDDEIGLLKEFNRIKTTKNVKSAFSIPPRKKIPTLLKRLTERKPEQLDYIGTSFGLTAELLRFWKSQKFVPVYLSQRPNDLTGEHSTILIFTINFDKTESKDWLSEYYKDFRRRILKLLGKSFQGFTTGLSLSLLDNRAIQLVADVARMATKTDIRKSKNFLMEEGLRIAVQKEIESFLENDEKQTLEFPASFTNVQRGFVHKYVQAKGLKSKSHGKGANRCLTISKPYTNTLISYDAELELSEVSTNEIKKFLTQNPLSIREMSEAKELAASKIPKKYYYGFATLKLTVPPPITISHEILETHMQLPITNYRQVIIDAINSNRVLVICGDTGSGKTTQVPQYLLEDCCIKQKKCRIICTQPRRIAAVSMADRVSYERNEDVGNTVGYQIRLESKINSNTNLVYTTSGFLLRCLISDTSTEWLKRATHIIMDEVHERDKYTDFLFIALKEALVKNPNLKLILMSATIDTNIFTSYFDNCPLMKIPGRMYPVTISQLEDVLGMIGYANEKIKKNYEPSPKHESPVPIQLPNILQSVNEESSAAMDGDRIQFINETLQNIFYGQTDFDQFFYLVTGEQVDVNIKHSETELTALMIAAINGLPDSIETLLDMGADPKIIGGLGYTAKEWAAKYDHTKCVELLEQAESIDPQTTAYDEIRKINQQRLQLYLDQTNETDIDHTLLFNTIKFIHEQMVDGSILVFLPGYDAIVEQMTTLNEGDIAGNVEVAVLHGNMQTSDQKKAFARASFGSRKVILSTNIAETSLTIDDVVYVIDCGKVKQISYDSLSESTTLTATWISKACAKQRMGRAGRTRPGFCYRLYSKQRFDAMEEFTLPELLRIPLTELCLHARIMTKTTIADYLSKAIQPPPMSTINQSIKLLKTIGALNDSEAVTELGYRLVDLPVDVQLGKILLYSILMRCLDPVLTIVSALSVKDPFVLNFENENQTKITRKKFAEDSCSDLMVFIKLFQSWTDTKVKGNCHQFCRENNVSNGTMEMISGFRSQIVGQLRTNGFIMARGLGDINYLNLNSNNFAVVKACFVAGFYPNICRVDRKVGNLKSKQEKKLLPHFSSVLREKNLKSLKSVLVNLPSEWVVFEEKSRVERLCLVRNNTIVSPITVALFGGPMYIPESNLITTDDSDSENDDSSKMKLMLDDWIYFILNEDIAVMIHQLRIKLNALFIRTLCKLEIKSGSNSNETKIIELISMVLEHEDVLTGFKRMNNVGERPIPSTSRFETNSKHSWRNKTNNHGNNGLQYNGKRTPAEYSHHQQQQYRGNVHQLASNNFNQTPPPNQQKCIVFRRNGNGSRATANNIRCESNQKQLLNEFEIFVADFKCQIMLKTRIRYFILQGRCKAAILQTYKPYQKWQYSTSSLRLLRSIGYSTNDVDIILFFLIPNTCFYGMGRMYHTAGGQINIESLSTKEVSIAEARCIKTTNHGHPLKTLDKFECGEEILNKNLAEQLFHLFLKKSFTS